jgi:hypothetical protein
MKIRNEQRYKSIYIRENVHAILRKEAFSSGMTMVDCAENAILDYVKWIKKADLAEAREQKELDKIAKTERELAEAKLNLDEAVLARKKKLLKEEEKWK